MKAKARYRTVSRTRTPLGMGSGLIVGMIWLTVALFRACFWVAKALALAVTLALALVAGWVADRRR